MKLRKLFSLPIILGISLAIPAVSFAGAIISEIMYDLPGTDTGREWIEVQNTGNEDVSFLKWKLFEANTNHGLTLFQGNATTSASGFMIIADDPVKFLADNPQYGGTLFGSSFSLSNSGETLELKVNNGSMYQTTYASTSGAEGDGNSLHYLNNGWHAGAPTPGSETSGEAQTPPLATQASSTEEANTGATTTEADLSETATPSPTAPSTGSTWVYKPQIYASAFVPQKGVAGAPVLFDAAAVGVKKEPLPNAHYVWSFGDGGTAEGKKIFHTYHYPAVYVVMVDASSGEWSATDRKEIAIAAPELVISNIKEGNDGFIELRNDGKSEVDLSLWLLKSAGSTFILPKGTVIGARKAIPFPAAITGLSANPSSTALLYPNGDLVVSYTQKQETPEPLPAKVETSKVTVAVSEKKDEPKAPIPEPVSAPVKKAVAPVPPVPSAPLVASSTELLGSVGTASGGGTMPWMLGVALLVVISTLGYLAMLRPRPEPTAAEQLRKEAAEFEIVE